MELAVESIDSPALTKAQLADLLFDFLFHPYHRWYYTVKLRKSQSQNLILRFS